MRHVEQVCPSIGSILAYQNSSLHSLTGKDHMSMKGGTTMETRVKAPEGRVNGGGCLRHHKTAQSLMNKINTTGNMTLTIWSSVSLEGSGGLECDVCTSLPSGTMNFSIR